MSEPALPSSSPSLLQRLQAWIDEDPTNRKLHIGSGVTIAALLGLCLWLGTRPAEQIETQVQVPVKAQLVAITVQKGDDLGSLGKPYGVSRGEMVGMNIRLLRENTARCDRKGNTSGVCRRDRFAEETLAFDAIFPGDVVYVVPRDALATPSALASTAQ